MCENAELSHLSAKGALTFSDKSFAKGVFEIGFAREIASRIALQLYMFAERFCRAFLVADFVEK